MWEISVPSPVFFSEPRTCLKIILIKKIVILSIVSRVTRCQLLPERGHFQPSLTLKAAYEPVLLC